MLLPLLDSLGIPYELHSHPPVFTCEEARDAVPGHAAVQTKNLFLRDKRGRRHLLLLTTCERVVDIKRFTELADADRLSFASPERMMKYLGVAPGAVTVFGLMNDVEHAVELYVDQELWNAPTWRCHPLVNDATIIVARDDIVRFLEKTGHSMKRVNR